MKMLSWNNVNPDFFFLHLFSYVKFLLCFILVIKIELIAI
jgi:hypothetical protein